MRVRGLCAFVIILLSVPGIVHAQARDNAGPWDLGVEVQQYPAGTIPTIRARVELADQLALVMNAGLNITYRRDLGVQDDERGVGFGGGMAIRYFPLARSTRLHLGARVDVFYLPITYDTEGGTAETDAVVLMPTAHLGWTFRLGPQDRWLIEPSVSFGREFNVVEDGEPVGEDFIGLIGVAVAYRL